MSRAARPLTDRQRGFALLIVLWTLALLALLGTQLVAAGRSDAQLARNLVDAAVLEAAANAGVQEAVFGALQLLPQRWPADGSAHVVRIGTVVVALRLEDETGKVNPNVASPALLASLLLQVGTSPATAASLAAGIVEWRGGAGGIGAAGPVMARYAAAGRDYAPSGAPFRSLDDLGLVLGMTPDLLERLRPHMTVWSDSDPDGSTHDAVVAAALGNLAASPGESLADLSVFTVIVDARAPGGGRFGERVVVRLAPQPGRRPYDILSLRRVIPVG